MAYRLKKGRSRRPSNRRFKRGGMKRMVKSVVRRAISKNTELKYFDTATSSGIDYAGTFFDLTALAVGDTDQTRDGDKITVKALKSSFTITSGDSTNLFRVCFFRWKQNTVSISPNQSYFSNPYLSATTSAFAPMNHDTRQNFQVLYDRTFTVNTVNKPQILVRANLNLAKLPKVSYDAGDVVGTNHIFMYVVSDSAAATHPSINMVNRILYVDS